MYKINVFFDEQKENAVKSECIRIAEYIFIYEKM